MKKKDPNARFRSYVYTNLMIPLYHNTRTKMLEICAKNAQYKIEHYEQKEQYILYIKHSNKLKCSNNNIYEFFTKKLIVDKNRKISIFTLCYAQRIKELRHFALIL